MMKTVEEVVSQVRENVQEISVDELSKLCENEIILIDVREHEEFVLGHIDGAVNLPRGVLEFKLIEHPFVSHHCDAKLALEDLSAENIYLICRSGGRSALAALALQRMGFSNIYSVAGGMLQWQKTGFKVK